MALIVLILTGSLAYVARSGEAAVWLALFAPKPVSERARDMAMVDTSPVIHVDRANPLGTVKIAEERAPVRDIVIDLEQMAPSSKPDSAAIPVYSAFDFLRGYLTNRTYPIIVDGIPWSNASINVQQYQEELGGVTYWDYWSESEDWNSPSYMFQDDAGTWQPYRTEVIRNAAGQETQAYLLVDRQGPGVMDKIWFTLDAIWMLATAQAIKDVGPIENMAEFLEWGNLDKLGNLRVEVDDRSVYDGSLRDWLSGKAWGLTPELAQILTWRHKEYGSSGSMLPVLYQKRLRMLLYGGSKKPFWLFATGVRFAGSVKPYTGTKTDLPLDEMTRLAQNVLHPESYMDTLENSRAFDLQVETETPATIRLNGAGTVEAMQFRIAKKYDPKDLWLTVKYGNEVGIDLPLIAFFGDPKYLVLHRSTPLGIVESEEAYIFYCNLPLPFQNGMTIQLATMRPNSLVVSARLAASPEVSNTQLWVLYRQATKLALYGPDYHVELPGDGKMVGLVLMSEEQDLDKIPKIFVPGTNVEDHVHRPWPMGFLEGNLVLKDGAGRSRMYGGHEDWADGGFYFNRGYTSPPGGSNRPFGGILRYKDGPDGYATVFRYFNDLSAFRFKNGLQMNLGHGTWKNNFPVKFGVTVYYYRQIADGR